MSIKNNVEKTLSPVLGPSAIKNSILQNFGRQPKMAKTLTFHLVHLDEHVWY